MTTMNPLTPTQRTAQTAIGDPPAVPAVEPDFELLAANLMQSIDALIAAIPRFEIPHDSTRKFVRTYANIPLPFLTTTLTSVGQDAQLQNAGGLDLAEGRRILQLLNAFEPLTAKVRNFLEALEYTMASQKATLAAAALRTYAIARAIARDKKSAAVGQLFANMQLALGRVRPKTRKAVEVPVGSPGIVL